MLMESDSAERQAYAYAGDLILPRSTGDMTDRDYLIEPSEHQLFVSCGKSLLH